MKKLALSMLAAVTIFVGCQKEQTTLNAPGKNSTTGGITKNNSDKQLSGAAGMTVSGNSFGDNYVVEKTVPLLAGQFLNVGNVTVASDEQYVYVTYNITLPVWRITELHLYLGDSTEIPANNSGNPVPGQFPNKITFKKIAVTSYSFTFPREDVGDCFSLAAHCVVNGAGSESAWGEGIRFPNGNQWGMYFNVCLTPTGPPKG